MLDEQGQPTGPDERPVPLSNLDFVTILVVGMDTARHVDLPPSPSTRFATIPLADVRGRADTLMVVGLDRRSHAIRILHIHRDTIVDLETRGPDKITHYMAYYSFFHLKKAVEQLLQMPIHRYVVVDFEGFQSLVDAIGGVTISVDHDLQAPDGVWLSEGTHRLDGATALRVVRHRYGEDEGVTARMELQHQFLQALGREIIAGGPARLLTAYRESADLIKTNLPPSALAALLREWRGASPDDVLQLSLPGSPEDHYWRLDQAGVKQALEEFWPREVRLGSSAPTAPGQMSPEVASAGRAGPWSFVSRALAGLAGPQGEVSWPLTYYPFLHSYPASPAPPVLLYHTHTTESYMPELFPDADQRALRDPNEDAFTDDLSRTVARVGDELTLALSHLGLQVRHVRVVHDPGGSSGRTGAYARSRESALSSLSRLRHPVIVLDIHRDATTTSTPLGHGQAASILLVVARQNPWWQWNYTFARNLDARLASEAPGLSRGVRVLDGRYNQDLSPLALIVEIGGADSTMDECLISARVFAGVLADYVGGP